MKYGHGHGDGERQKRARLHASSSEVVLMPQPISSTTLSILSFALNSWLDGSSQLRRSLVLFPFHAQNPQSDSELRVEVGVEEEREQASSRTSLGRRVLRWLTQPSRELTEVERLVLGSLDVSSSLLLLKLLGTEPILPVILNPLSITLALPRSLSIGKLRWSRVILFCLLLSVLGEAQRTSVAAGLAWLKFKKRACRSVHVGQVELGGKSLPIRDGDDDDDDDDEIEESCVICSGGSADALSDSVSSITSLASHAGPSSRPGPLETFCTHAPTKHPMHRSCFTAWRDAYWEGRTSDSFSGPVFTLVSDDSVVPLPGTWHWRRSQAILSAALGPRILRAAVFIPVSPEQLPQAELIATTSFAGNVGEAVFKLRSGEPTISTSECSDEYEDGDGSILGELVSAWPPCPGCRSAVKMVFTKVQTFTRTQQTTSTSTFEGKRTRVGEALGLWKKTWKELATGRALLVKTATQVLFAIFLVSMIKVRSNRLRAYIIPRQSS